MQKHTAGPWKWTCSSGRFWIETIGRGRLIVMDFVRMGMNAAQPRFSKWTGDERERQGGVMHKAEEMGELHDHPDARLIVYAPDLLEALKGLVSVSKCENGCAVDDMTCETNRALKVIRLVEGVKEESPR